MIGSQSGSVISVTKISPSLKSDPSNVPSLPSKEYIFCTFPCPILSPTAIPVNLTTAFSELSILYSTKSLSFFLECIVSGLACTINKSPVSPSTAHSVSIGHQCPFSSE